MSHEILGGGTGSSQMGPWGMCRFWEGSWLDLIVLREKQMRSVSPKPFFSLVLSVHFIAHNLG
jgi:hypothetical protein